MSLTTANVDVTGDWVGTENTELDGLMIRGDELTIRGCELLSKLIKQSIKGGIGIATMFSYGFPGPFLWKASYII